MPANRVRRSLSSRNDRSVIGEVPLLWKLGTYHDSSVHEPSGESSTIIISDSLTPQKTQKTQRNHSGQRSWPNFPWAAAQPTWFEMYPLCPEQLTSHSQYLLTVWCRQQPADRMPAKGRLCHQAGIGDHGTGLFRSAALDCATHGGFMRIADLSPATQFVRDRHRADGKDRWDSVFYSTERDLSPSSPFHFTVILGC